MRVNGEYRNTRDVVRIRLGFNKISWYKLIMYCRRQQYRILMTGIDS